MCWKALSRLRVADYERARLSQVYLFSYLIELLIHLESLNVLKILKLLKVSVD